MGQIGRYFKASEFACPCCKKTNPSPLLVKILDATREVLGPLRVNSGYRCPEHNKSVGGKKSSYHLFRDGVCLAADISYPDPTKRHGEHILRLYVELENAARRHGVAYGLGLYNSFCHIDTRGEAEPGKMARWSQFSWVR